MHHRTGRVAFKGVAKVAKAAAAAARAVELSQQEGGEGRMRSRQLKVVAKAAKKAAAPRREGARPLS